MENPQLFGTVLLVEDDAAHALIIKRALKRYAGSISTGETIEQARKLLEDRLEPDLIVSDLHLPDSNGLAHLDDLKSLAPDVPILVLTASTSIGEAVEAMKRGAMDYIVKNFDSQFPEVLGLALSRLFAGLQLREEKLRLQKQMEVLHLAIEYGSDALAVIRTTGEIAYANKSFFDFIRLVGGDPRSVFELFSEEVDPGGLLRERIRQSFISLAPGGVWNTEISFPQFDDAAFDLSLSYLSTSDSDPDEFVLWVRDVREDKRREKFQREILSTTTHDLKGPLGAISISSEMLSDMLEPHTKARELNMRIASCAQGALNLIDQFLSARRIQEGAFVLRPESQPILPIVEQVLEDYRTIASVRDIEIVVQCEDPGLTANLDRLGFVRVLGNLVSNACKFSRKNEKVWIRLYSSGSGMHCEVQDSGSGMEPSEVHRIFERFSRLRQHENVPGSGLGLFVVKSIVTAHGGNVQVMSSPGSGTKFEVVFPNEPPVNERGELISLDFT